jgi:hypothetical protein
MQTAAPCHGFAWCGFRLGRLWDIPGTKLSTECAAIGFALLQILA